MTFAKSMIVALSGLAAAFAISPVAEAKPKEKAPPAPIALPAPPVGKG